MLLLQSRARPQGLKQVMMLAGFAASMAKQEALPEAAAPAQEPAEAPDALLQPAVRQEAAAAPTQQGRSSSPKAKKHRKERWIHCHDLYLH